MFLQLAPAKLNGYSLHRNGRRRAVKQSGSVTEQEINPLGDQIEKTFRLLSGMIIKENTHN